MNGKQLTGQVVLVTGASRGFGRAIAELFAQEGASLILIYRSNLAACEEVADYTRELGGRAVSLQADVANQHQVQAVVARALEEFGRIDVLVNNAGVMVLEDFATSSEDSWMSQINVNIFGALRVSRAVLPQMVEIGSGSIINLSSQLAYTGWENGAVYAATKGFLSTYTKSLAREVGQCGVRVNAVAPGGIATDMNSSLYASQGDRDRRAQDLPLRRLGTPRDVAQCALFLASESAGFLTGQTLGPNGGRVMV